MARQRTNTQRPFASMALAATPTRSPRVAGGHSRQTSSFTSRSLVAPSNLAVTTKLAAGPNVATCAAIFWCDKTENGEAEQVAHDIRRSRRSTVIVWLAQ